MAQQKVAGLAARLVRRLARGGHRADGLEPRPIMALLQPSDVGAETGAALFDAAMIAIDGRGRRQRRLGIVEKELHILKKRALIALERQDVVAALGDDLGCDLPLAMEGIRG